MMKSLLPLYTHLLNDASKWCSVSTTRDLETITRRVEHEGLSFLTITLPTYCQDFEQALALGQVVPHMFLSFSKHKAIPRFLGGLLELVFSRKTGLLLDNPNTDAIFFIRQICLVCKKIKLPCSPRRERKAFDGYVKCEQEVEDVSKRFTKSQLGSFERVSDLLWGRALNRINHMVFAGDHVPRHGSGSTADKSVGNQKYDNRTWTRRLDENFFSSSDFAIPNYGFADSLRDYTFLEPGAEIPVKVISVPKTLKTPRIIAMEPTCIQYAQQALLEILVPLLERDRLVGPLIGFTDQKPNQEYARLGSITGSLSTLDLSEASDRVSLRLVTRMTYKYSHFMRALMACRSKTASLPDGSIRYLRKFASMGSALCFPIEAMVFLTIVFVAIEKQLNRPLRRRDIISLQRKVRVYGDDIIIPVEYTAIVIEQLLAFGLKVNLHKSFYTGKFRESCGSDWYDGQDVKPVYLRHLFADNYRQASEFTSMVSFRNQLYKAGLWDTTEWLDRSLKRLAPFPIVLDTSPVLGRHSYSFDVSSEKWDDLLHRPLVKGVVHAIKHRSNPLNGIGALMKFFLKRGESPYLDKDHLKRSGRPDSVDTRVRWAYPR
jgi:hypothetical protein